MSSISSSGPPAGSSSPPFAAANRTAMSNRLRSQKRDSLTPEAQASQAEADANVRIANASTAAQQAEVDSRHQIDAIQDSYANQSEKELSREEGLFEQQKLKGYEQLRDLQRQQQVDLAKARRAGEDELLHLKEHYRDSIYHDEQKGKEDLKELQTQSYFQQQYERKNDDVQTDNLKSANKQRLDSLKGEEDQIYREQVYGANQRYEKMKETTAEANERSRQHFLEQHTQLIDSQNTTLDDINHRTSQRINDIRTDTSRKLSAYSSRQSDPFYKMMKIDADLTEHSDRFVLTAQIPEFEQPRVTVALHGNSVVVSANRANEEQSQLGHGRARSTSSYQSFSESFPLSYPVDGARIVKETDGDTIRVTLYKKNEFAFQENEERAKPPTPGRIAAERPRFPGNLPVPKDPPPEPEDPDRKPSKPTLGERTLS